VIYGFVMTAIMLLAAVGMLAFGMSRPEMMPLAIFYFLYGGIGFALLFPLHRSSEALKSIPSHGASACLETFATEQSAFWRRIGVICVASLVLLGAAVVIGGLAGAMMTR
jgi:hypothetical protein